ncbi:MAG: VWA domain-containing protein [Blastocatellia bacterium]|nr:VWA domain-containing protein [Blastocatellia bacterium]
MQFVQRFLANILLGCLVFSSSSIAQDKKAKDKAAKQQIRITFNFESLEGLPADAKLQAENLKVLEDGVEQKIDVLDSNSQGISYGVLIDTSGSMREYLPNLVLLTISLVDQLGSADEMFIAQGKAEAELLQDMTSNKEELYNATKSLFTGGGSALYDNIIAGADHLKEKGKHSRRVLIVLTDVVERGSLWKLNEMVAAISEDDVQLAFIRLLNQELLKRSAQPGESTEKTVAKGTSVFDSLAILTGGIFVRYSAPIKITKGEAPALLQAASDYTKPIFQHAKIKYRLSYLTANQKYDGRPRNAQVIWQNQEGKTISKEFSFVVPKK